MAKRPSDEARQEETSQQPAPSGSSNSTTFNPDNHPALKASLRIPTSYPTGAPYVETVDQWTTYDGSEAAIERSFYVINGPSQSPGVCVINYAPTYGFSDKYTSALNRATFNAFNVIRCTISGTRRYEPSDYAIYRTSVNHLRQFYNTVKRNYAIMRTYSATNVYRPFAILKALGLNASDWLNNSARIYQWLVDKAKCMRDFPTVSMGAVDSRHEVFCSHIFTDGEPDCTQMYIFNQLYYYSYEKVDEVKGLTPRFMPETWDEVVAVWDEMYAGLMQSTDVYIMAADTRHAFGDKILTELTPPAVDAEIQYVKNDMVLTSLMNAVPLAYGYMTQYNRRLSNYMHQDMARAFRIYDKSGNLMCTPRLQGMISRMGEEGCISIVPRNRDYLNMIQADPSPTDIMAAMLFNAHFTPEKGSKNTVKYLVDTFGTEIVVDVTYVDKPTGNSVDMFDLGGAMIYNNNVYPASQINTEAWATYILRMIATVSNFDWHVPHYFGYAAGNALNEDGDIPNGPVRIWAMEDVQNYVPITNEQRRMIFDAYLLAQFDVD